MSQEPSAPTPAPVAFISGSGRDRVGQVVARDLAEAGYRLALHYHRSADAARENRDQLRAAGTECEIFQADLTRPEEVERALAAVLAEFGRIDVLVCTSSIWGPGKLEDVTAEDLQQNFAVNTAASFFCARTAGLQMSKQEGGGSIIFFGDAAIDRPYADHAAYFISKGALPTLTRVLAVEFSQRNPQVRVNCIQPGPILLPPKTSEPERQALREATLVKQAHCPEMIALTVRFLINNTFLTGACIPLDGGRNLASETGFERHQSQA